MAMAVDALLGEAMALSEQDRADLATRLIASLDGEVAEDPDEVEAAWATEIEARAARVRAGEPTIEWRDARQRILAEPGG